MVKSVFLEPRCKQQLDEFSKSDKFAYGLIFGQVSSAHCFGFNSDITITFMSAPIPGAPALQGRQRLCHLAGANAEWVAFG